MENMLPRYRDACITTDNTNKTKPVRSSLRSSLLLLLLPASSSSVSVSPSSVQRYFTASPSLLPRQGGGRAPLVTFSPLGGVPLAASSLPSHVSNTSFSSFGISIWNEILSKRFSTQVKQIITL